MGETEQASTLRWSADEHHHVERTSDWFWALGVIAIATSITAIIFSNILFAVLIIVAAATMGLIARTPPRTVEFEISDAGVRVDGFLYEYKKIVSFWVEKDESPLLLIDTVKFMSPNVIIPIEGIAPESVRERLLPHAKEVEMREPLAHKIVEFFGF